MIWFIGDIEAHYDGAGAVTHVYSHLSMGTPVARVDRTGEHHDRRRVPVPRPREQHDRRGRPGRHDQRELQLRAVRRGHRGDRTPAAPHAGTAAHKRRLNDKYEDDLTALAYYGARYYDKTLIGWTQADPLYVRLPDLAHLSAPRRANVYGFSLNNPLRYMDPDGLDSSARGPGPHLSQYKTESEIRDDWRRLYTLEDDWEIPTGMCAYNTNWCSFILNQAPSRAFRVIDSPSPVFKPEDMDLAARYEWERKNLRDCDLRLDVASRYTWQGS